MRNEELCDAERNTDQVAVGPTNVLSTKCHGRVESSQTA